MKVIVACTGQNNSDRQVLWLTTRDDRYASMPIFMDYAHQALAAVNGVPEPDLDEYQWVPDGTTVGTVDGKELWMQRIDTTALDRPEYTRGRTQVALCSE